MTDLIEQLITEQNLRRVIDGKSIGDKPPWREKFAPTGRARLYEVANYLKERQSLTVELIDSYGSGWVSYLDLFIYPSNGSTIVTKKQVGQEISGVSLWLSYSAPLAIYGATKKTKKGSSGSSGFLHPASLYKLPRILVENGETHILNALKNAGFYVLPEAVAKRKLTFETQIETNLGENPFRIFDVFFNWMD
ncbi:MAG: hypothetical protein GXP21_05075 [Gammaproteobacteria bacterium]|nr:hypothetical protein [Gammaproteobacteria bacterium]